MAISFCTCNHCTISENVWISYIQLHQIFNVNLVLPWNIFRYFGDSHIWLSFEPFLEHETDIIQAENPTCVESLSIELSNLCALHSHWKWEHLLKAIYGLYLQAASFPYSLRKIWLFSLSAMFWKRWGNPVLEDCWREKENVWVVFVLVTSCISEWW